MAANESSRRLFLKRVVTATGAPGIAGTAASTATAADALPPPAGRESLKPTGRLAALALQLGEELGSRVDQPRRI